MLISGPAGVGKTYLLCALANQACRQGLSAKYYRISKLLSDLNMARGDGSYPKFMGRLANFHLLALDDWDLATLTAPESRDILDIIGDRCHNRSTVLASQLPLEHWHETMTNPAIADAVLDSLVHAAHKIKMKGESMRKLKS